MMPEMFVAEWRDFSTAEAKSWRPKI